MNPKPRTSKILLLAAAFLLLLLAAILALAASAQDQLTAGLRQRLEQEGVPVREAVIADRLPFEIKIALNSSSPDSDLTVDDNWYMTLARREALFSYRTHPSLSSYTLTVYNAKNELIYSTQTYLHPQDLDQQTDLSASSMLEDAAARQIIALHLQIGGLSLDKLEVEPDPTTGGGQILLINVSAEDLAAANASLPGFLGSLFPLLETANDRYGTSLVLCHLQVSDRQGTILLDYVKDLQSGSAQWTSVEGLYNEWFPHPGVTPRP